MPDINKIQQIQKKERIKNSNFAVKSFVDKALCVTVKFQINKRVGKSIKFFLHIILKH